MSWRRRFETREYITESLWIIPFLFMVGAIVLAMVLEALDRRFDWALFGFSASAAQGVLSAIAGSMITFTGFVFSTVMVALQFASAQISPRVVKSAFSDPRTKIALGTFVFTFMFSLVGLSDVTTDRVPQLTVTVGVLSVVASVIVFLMMIHMLSRDLRAANMAQNIEARVRKTVASTHPIRSSDLPTVLDFDGREGQVINSDREGILKAYDREGLVALATAGNAMVELLPSMGDYVPLGAPLFKVYDHPEAVDQLGLQERVALGPERTIQQDPAFGLRILVDAGAKALSPGVNDPTTAVVAIDHIHGVLNDLALRELAVGIVHGDHGEVRFVSHHPGWEDYVSLAVDELRIFSEGSMQVARRLRAMLEDLLEVVPDDRRGPLLEQRELLDAVVDRGLADHADRARARIADHQGIGGSRRSRSETELSSNRH